MQDYKNIKFNIFLLGIFIFIIFSAIFLTKSAIFSIDEASMVLTFDGIEKTGALQVQNGYEKMKSEELNCFNNYLYDDKLHSKHPPLYFYAVFPIYYIFGVIGLIWLNVLSTILICYLVYKLTLEISSSVNMAMQTVSLLLFATYIIQYSIAIWPHMFNLFLLVFAIKLIRDGINNDKKTYLIYYSGIISGLSAGVRLSSLITIGLISLFVLIESKSRFRSLSSYAVGLSVPITLTSFINFQRFKIANPLIEYPGSIQSVNTVSYLVIFTIFLLSFLIPILYKYFYKKNEFKNRNLSFYVFILSILIITAASILSITSIPEDFTKYLRNFFGYVFNSVFIQQLNYDAASYNSLGILTYHGIIKKALFQSCPYLILILLAPFYIKKLEIESKDKKLLLLLTLGYPLLYSVFNFHGGMGYNFRYFIDLLPWAVLLVVLLIGELNIRHNMMELFVLLMVFFSLILTFSPDNTPLNTLLIVAFPPIISIGLIISFVLYKRFKSKTIFRRVFSYILIASIAISFSLAYFEDLPSVTTQRVENYRKAKAINEVISDKAIMFVYWGYKDHISLVKISKDLLIADYHRDRGSDFFRLLDEAGKENRKAYLYGEGVHPELLEILGVEYDLVNVSKTLIPIYHIRKKSFLDNKSTINPKSVIID